MNKNDEKKIEELFKDQEFAKKVLLKETPENACELLKEKGVDVSVEEMGQVRGFIEKVKNGEISEEQLKRMQDGELELEDMKQVAGGFAPLIPVFIGLAAVLFSVSAVAVSNINDKQS